MIKLANLKYDGPTMLPHDEFINSCFQEEGWEVEELGLSSDGVTPVYGMKYGDVENKPVIFITNGHHGNEWVPLYSGQAFRDIWNKPNIHPNYKVIEKMKRTFAIYSIPLVNPSGYILRQTTGVETNGRQNANGVDLNRNYLADEPEPEVKLVKEKMLELSPIAMIDNHSYILTEALGYGDPEEPFYRQLYWYAMDNLANVLTNYEGAKDTQMAKIVRGRVPHYADPTYESGQGRAWVNHQINKYGKKTLSFLIEEHRRGPTERGMEFGVNAFVVLMYHIHQYWTEGKQRVAWKSEI